MIKDSKDFMLVTLLVIVLGAVIGRALGMVTGTFDKEQHDKVLDAAQSFTRNMHPGAVIRTGCGIQKVNDGWWCTSIVEAADTRYTYQLTCNESWCKIDGTVYY